MRARSAARRRPTTAFFVATFVLTWVVWVPRALASHGVLDAPWIVELGAAWSYGPAAAALVVAGLLGREALRDLGRRLTRYRVSWRWYALVLIGPAAFWAVVLVVVGVLGLLGVPYDGEAAPRPPLATLGVSALPLFGVLVLTDGLGEETGWRAFALPRLLRRLPILGGGVVLGLVWACWHMPLLWTKGSPLEGSSPWVLLLELPALSLVYSWIFRSTGGSAVPAILLHAATNLSTVSATAASARDGRVAAVILLLEWMLAASTGLRRARVGRADTAATRMQSGPRPNPTEAFARHGEHDLV